MGALGEDAKPLCFSALPLLVTELVLLLHLLIKLLGVYAMAPRF